MWMFTKYGFFSVVCARVGDGKHDKPVDLTRMMVRARVRRHLESLKFRFPELLEHCEIKQFDDTDYAYRLFVDKATWSQVAAALSNDVDYDNFKAEAARFQGTAGQRYEQALHDVWSVMRSLQSGPQV